MCVWVESGGGRRTGRGKVCVWVESGGDGKWKDERRGNVCVSECVCE